MPSLIIYSFVVSTVNYKREHIILLCALLIE